MPQSRFSWRKVRDSQVFWPLVALALLMLFNALFTPGFFRLEMKDGHLFGSLIDILNRGSVLMVMAIGMTMVIATGGVDLSVGAVMAISASTAGVLITSATLDNTLVASDQLVQNVSATPFWLVITIALAVSALCGLWNGLLVSRGNIQPMVATLILMVAGRGIAQLITNGQIITIYFTPYYFLGNGYLLALPFTLFLVLGLYLITWLFTRRTAVGMFVESVGINARSSFLSGINAKNIKLMAYTLCGTCAGLAGLMYSANVKSADANNVGLNMELDAILAVVIGGTLMSGGRFSLLASMVGALIIQSVTTTMYALGVPAMASQAIKALVVLIVILLYSDVFRTGLNRVFEGKGARP